MIGEIRQNFTEASASVGLILATALLVHRLQLPLYHQISVESQEVQSYL